MSAEPNSLFTHQPVLSSSSPVPQPGQSSLIFDKITPSSDGISQASGRSLRSNKKDVDKVSSRGKSSEGHTYGTKSVLSEHTMMKTVEESWVKVVQKATRKENIGLMMYDTLNRLVPEITKLYRKGRAQMAIAFEAVCSAVVAYGSQEGELKDQMKMLGIRHVHYMASPELFPAFKKALLLSLEHFLSEVWDDDHQQAWSWVWDRAARSLEASLVEASKMMRVLFNDWHVAADNLGEESVIAKLQANLMVHSMSHSSSPVASKTSALARNVYDMIKEMMMTLRSIDRLTMCQAAFGLNFRTLFADFGSIPDLAKIEPVVIRTMSEVIGQSWTPLNDVAWAWLWKHAKDEKQGRFQRRDHLLLKESWRKIKKCIEEYITASDEREDDYFEDPVKGKRSPQGNLPQNTLAMINNSSGGVGLVSNTNPNNNMFDTNGTLFESNNNNNLGSSSKRVVINNKSNPDSSSGSNSPSKGGGGGDNGATNKANSSSSVVAVVDKSYRVKSPVLSASSGQDTKSKREASKRSPYNQSKRSNNYDNDASNSSNQCAQCLSNTASCCSTFGKHTQRLSKIIFKEVKNFVQPKDDFEIINSRAILYSLDATSSSVNQEKNEELNNREPLSLKGLGSSDLTCVYGGSTGTVGAAAVSSSDNQKTRQQLYKFGPNKDIVVEDHVCMRLALIFLQGVYRRAPTLRHIFIRPPHEYAQVFVALIRMLFSYLGDLDSMWTENRDLAVKHINFGVDTTKIPLFGKVFIEALSEVCNEGQYWCDDYSRVWSALYANASRGLSDVIAAGSHPIVRALIQGGDEEMRQALAESPRNIRVDNACQITLGGQFKSPLYWCIDTGKMGSAVVLLHDILAIRVDRERYYYGRKKLWETHPDLIPRLVTQAPHLLPVLLDGLVWCSEQATSGVRRVIFYLEELWGDPSYESSGAHTYTTPLACLLLNADEEISTKLFQHPVLSFLVETKWNMYASRRFKYKSLVYSFQLLFFIVGYILSPSILDHPAALTCRVIAWLLALLTTGFDLWHFHQQWIRGERTGSLMLPYICFNPFRSLRFVGAVLVIAVASMELSDGIVVADKSSKTPIVITLSTITELLFWVLTAEVLMGSKKLLHTYVAIKMQLSLIGRYLVMMIFLILSTGTLLATNVPLTDSPNDDSTYDDEPHYNYYLAFRISLAYTTKASWIPDSDESTKQFLRGSMLLLCVVFGLILTRMLTAMIIVNWVDQLPLVIGLANKSVAEFVLETDSFIGPQRVSEYTQEMNFDVPLAFDIESDLGPAGGIAKNLADFEPPNSTAALVQLLGGGDNGPLSSLLSSSSGAARYDRRIRFTDDGGDTSPFPLGDDEGNETFAALVDGHLKTLQGLYQAILKKTRVHVKQFNAAATMTHKNNDLASQVSSQKESDGSKVEGKKKERRSSIAGLTNKKNL